MKQIVPVHFGEGKANRGEGEIRQVLAKPYPHQVPGQNENVGPLICLRNREKERKFQKSMWDVWSKMKNYKVPIIEISAREV